MRTPVSRPELPHRAKFGEGHPQLPLRREFLYQIEFFDDGASDGLFGIVRSPGDPRFMELISTAAQGWVVEHYSR